MANALRIAGHVVARASTRAAALALMTRHRYGLVVSNLRMPDLNGPTLYEELARHSPRALTRLIFIAQSAFSPEYSTFLMEVGTQQAISAAAGLLPFGPRAVRQRGPARQFGRPGQGFLRLALLSRFRDEGLHLGRTVVDP